MKEKHVKIKGTEVNLLINTPGARDFAWLHGQIGKNSLDLDTSSKELVNHFKLFQLQKEIQIYFQSKQNRIISVQI